MYQQTLIQGQEKKQLHMGLFFTGTEQINL